MKLKIAEAVHQKKKRREEKELLEAEGLARPRIGATTTERGGPYVQFQSPRSIAEENLLLLFLHT